MCPMRFHVLFSLKSFIIVFINYLFQRQVSPKCQKKSPIGFVLGQILRHVLGRS
jgi:hypothetical protein